MAGDAFLAPQLARSFTADGGGRGGQHTAAGSSGGGVPVREPHHAPKGHHRQGAAELRTATHRGIHHCARTVHSGQHSGQHSGRRVGVWGAEHGLLWSPAQKSTRTHEHSAQLHNDLRSRSTYKRAALQRNAIAPRRSTSTRERGAVTQQHARTRRRACTAAWRLHSHRRTHPRTAVCRHRRPRTCEQTDRTAGRCRPGCRPTGGTRRRSRTPGRRWRTWSAPGRGRTHTSPPPHTHTAHRTCVQAWTAPVREGARATHAPALQGREQWRPPQEQACTHTTPSS